MPPFLLVERGHWVACWKVSHADTDNISRSQGRHLGSQELHAVLTSALIRDREILSLIGESGSGKSTIGKMILRLI